MAPINVAAPNTPYFTPAQAKPAGQALSDSAPTLFSPLKIRSAVFQNRIWVAPMCMYSADNGYLTDFHFTHLSAFAFRGASLTIIEATGVQPEGRITPQCAGLWEDGQIAPIKRLATFVHSQGQKLGIQLAHAGRKASTVAPWLTSRRGVSILATEDVGGWPDNVKGPSAIKWGDGYADPREMSIQDIQEMVRSFGDAARRAVEADVDVIEIHAAHGYLLQSFTSPISNQRTDRYGGSFENRIRAIVEVVQAVRSAIPDGMPLLLRMSCTEWMDGHPAGSWKIQDTIALARLLPGLGVDLLDCSSGGNHPEQQISMHSDFQVGIAGQIRTALHTQGIRDLLIGAVGMITEAEVAREIVEVKESGTKAQPEGGMEIVDEKGSVARADVVLVARQFLREPEWVFRVAHRLGVQVAWPVQYQRGRFLRGSRI